MNVLATIQMTLDIPESVVEKIAGVDPGDDEEYYQRTLDLIKNAVEDDTNRFLEYVVNDPDVDVDG